MFHNRHIFHKFLLLCNIFSTYTLDFSNNNYCLIQWHEKVACVKLVKLYFQKSNQFIFFLSPDICRISFNNKGKAGSVMSCPYPSISRSLVCLCPATFIIRIR